MFLETQIVQDKILILKYHSQEHKFSEDIQKAVIKPRKKEKSTFSLPDDTYLLVKYTAPFTFATLYQDPLFLDTAELLLENLECKFAEILDAKRRPLTPEDKEEIYDYLEKLTFYCTENSLKGSLKEPSLIKSEYDVIDIEDDSSTEKSFTSDVAFFRKKRSPLLKNGHLPTRLRTPNVNLNASKPKWTQILIIVLSTLFTLAMILLLYIQGGY